MTEISKMTRPDTPAADGPLPVPRRRSRVLATTEVPTFFGPPDSPLFGVVHLPVDNQIRGGVLICGSLGKEGADSIRLQRILADDLARRGFCVLHFDYLGSGDSAYAQGRDDAVANWAASVGHALEYLTLIGAEATTAVGIRAGCLILNEYLAQHHKVNGAVYFDPPGTGRRYLREHSTLYRLSVGSDAGTPGEVSVIGARFSDHAAAEFGALKMGVDPVGAYGLDNVLLVGRPAETDKHLTALAGANGVDSIVADGLPECAQPRETLLPIPFTAVESVVDWVDQHAPARSYPATPQYQVTATMPAEGPDGADVVEHIERVEPHALFAIRTVPLGAGAAPEKTVMFFVTANDSHTGPVREWVELSRRVAAAGSHALRWDPAGLGLSGQVNRESWRDMYSKRDITDSIAMAKHARGDGDGLELVGICSGSWYAAHVARSTDAQSAILINLLAWNWSVRSTLLSQWSTRKKTLNAVGEADGAALSEYRRRRLGALLKPARERSKNLMHNHLPRPVLRVLNHVGLLWLPEELLKTLAQHRTDVTVIASPEDTELFAAKGGLAALDRLQMMQHPPRLNATPTGDHAAHHPTILSAIRDAVLPATSEAAVSEPRPVPGSAAAESHQSH
jgi:pimeloyl-ACP methyl ester carboxylesterase